MGCHRLLRYYSIYYHKIWALPVAQCYRIHLPMQETGVPSLGQEDPLEKEMATQSSVLTWKIPWVEETGRLQSIELPRVRNGWATNTCGYWVIISLALYSTFYINVKSSIILFQMILSFKQIDKLIYRIWCILHSVRFCSFVWAWHSSLCIFWIIIWC